MLKFQLMDPPINNLIYIYILYNRSRQLITVSLFDLTKMIVFTED